MATSPFAAGSAYAPNYSTAPAPAPYVAPAPPPALRTSVPITAPRMAAGSGFGTPTGAVANASSYSALGAPRTYETSRPVAIQDQRDYQYNQQAAQSAATQAKAIQDATNASWHVDQYGNMSFDSGMAPTNFASLQAALNANGGNPSAAYPPPATFTPYALPERHRTDNSMADSASFARAKDRVGQSTRASMNALRSAMSERGIAGSGIEGAGIGQIIGQGQGQIGDFNREAAIRDFDANNAIDEGDFQAAMRIAEANGQGVNSTANQNADRAVSMRGQDLSSQRDKIAQLESLARLRNYGVVY
jgi:hypothetical protein